MLVYSRIICVRQARNLRLAGMDRDVIMKITGHKTDSMFRRYNIVDQTSMRRSARWVCWHDLIYCLFPIPSIYSKTGG